MGDDPKKKNPAVMIFVAIGCAVMFIPCVGVMAAIAIPAFIGYLTRAKTSEAGANLRQLFQGASAYYEEERTGPDGTLLTHCVVDSARTPNVPGSGKTVLSGLPPSFADLAWAPMDPVYYQYEIVSVGGCGHAASTTELYSFRAHGDLDGDGVQSLYELASGSDGSNALIRAPGVYRENELE